MQGNNFYGVLVIFFAEYFTQRGQSDAFFAVLRLVTESDRRASSSHSTREILLRDAFSRALETEVDAIKIAMQNLQKYVDLVFSQVYNAELMQCIPPSFLPPSSY